MKRAVWLILNENFTLTLDGEIENEKVIDKKFSPGSDIWTNELPQLSFENTSIQKEYNEFIEDIINLFSEVEVNKVLIDAKIGEESEYVFAKKPLVIRKIEEYDVDEIIE